MCVCRPSYVDVIWSDKFVEPGLIEYDSNFVDTF
jgi:hypothetical protein